MAKDNISQLDTLTTLSEPMVLEFEQESVATRKALERVPFDKFDWKPHEKSMSLGELACHIADIPRWMKVTVNQSEFDPITEGYGPFVADSADDLMETFDRNFSEAREILSGASNENLLGNWIMTMGAHPFLELPKINAVRTWILNHTVHHRGQLTVYLRENDIAVPAAYASSADETA